MSSLTLQFKLNKILISIVKLELHIGIKMKILSTYYHPCFMGNRTVSTTTFNCMQILVYTRFCMLIPMSDHVYPYQKWN